MPTLLGVLDDVATLVGVSKDAVLAMIVTFASIAVGYILSARSQRRSSVFERKLDAYAQLRSYCREIIQRSKDLESLAPNALTSCLVPSLGISDPEWQASQLVNSWEDVLNAPISRWIRFSGMRLVGATGGNCGYRPLNFFYWTEYQAGSEPLPTPIHRFLHQRYEDRIISKGVELYFSKEIRIGADAIYEMSRSPEKHEDVTTRAFIAQVENLHGEIQREVKKA